MSAAATSSHSGDTAAPPTNADISSSTASMAVVHSPSIFCRAIGISSYLTRISHLTTGNWQLATGIWQLATALLRIPNPPVLGLEEPRQQRVHAEQALATEPNVIPLDARPPF